jgi:hypothetical protein
MRSHSVIAIIAILIAGFGVTLSSFSHPTANSFKSSRRDVSQTREPAPAADSENPRHERCLFPKRLMALQRRPVQRRGIQENQSFPNIGQKSLT